MYLDVCDSITVHCILLNYFIFIVLKLSTNKYIFCKIQLFNFTTTNLGQKRIMRVQRGGIFLLGWFNVLLNAFKLSFIT